MKKGRPAHTVHALAPRDLAPRLRAVLFGHTTTFGVRELAAAKYALPRRWIAVGTGTGTVRIKIAHQDGVIVQATPEFDDASQLAAQSGQPVRAVLAQADAAASAAGLVPGLPVPAG
jgi:pyridinium-3,5-bisthiocarboxylic acid mononucleotide nickel chelatase